MVLFEALCLGVPASLAGLIVGYVLCDSVFHQSTSYLSEAFTLSGVTVLQPAAIVLSLLGGVLATCAASAVPLLDLRKGRARDAIYENGGVPGHALSRGTRMRLAARRGLPARGGERPLGAAPAAAIPATALARARDGARRPPHLRRRARRGERGGAASAADLDPAARALLAASDDAALARARRDGSCRPVRQRRPWRRSRRPAREASAASRAATPLTPRSG